MPVILIFLHVLQLPMVQIRKEYETCWFWFLLSSGQYFSHLNPYQLLTYPPPSRSWQSLVVKVLFKFVSIIVISYVISIMYYLLLIYLKFVNLPGQHRLARTRRVLMIFIIHMGKKYIALLLSLHNVWYKCLILPVLEMLARLDWN